MARAKADKAYTNFGAGFITEATGLTFPENSLRDVDNCDLELKGTVRRRLGVSQETGGVGIGSIAPTNYPNSGGGPLSADPGANFAFVTNAYDGVTGNADWVLTASSNGESAVVSGEWRMASTQGHYGSMQNDIDFTLPWDLATFTFEAAELTSNEPVLDVCIGVDGACNGEGFAISRNGISKCSYAGRTNADRTVVEGLVAGNFEPHYRYSIFMTRTGPSVWAVTLLVTEPDTSAQVVQVHTTIATPGDYWELKVASGQGHTGRFAVDNLSYTLQQLADAGGAGETEVPAEELAVSRHVWTNVAGIDGVNWVVFQVGNTLHFRDLEQEAHSIPGGTVPANSTSLVFDGVGTGFVYRTTAGEAARVRLQSASGSGRIWFTSSAVIPFYAEYLQDEGRIVIRPVGYRVYGDAQAAITGQRLIRDFNGVKDDLNNDENPTSLSTRHLYNLLNQGWNGTRIDAYFADQSTYPSNAQQWILGRDANDDFDPTVLAKQDFGNGPAPKGRFTIDALTGDKDGRVHNAAGVANPLNFLDSEDEVSLTGWSAIGFAAGRLWLSGDTNSKRPNGIYFSKVVSSPEDSGIFMQVNDPTSEHFPDLLDTDGGVVYIPEAERITELVPFSSGIVALATNGIWFIYGGDQGFAATSIAVDKVSSVGVISADTTVVADGGIGFWSDSGVYILKLPERGAIPVVEDVSETRILQYYNSIPLNSRRSATGSYDAVTKKIVWFWLDDDEDVRSSVFNRALILDTRTLAFTKYSFPVYRAAGQLFGVAGAYSRLRPTIALSQELVTVGGVVVTVGGVPVTVDAPYRGVVGLQGSVKLLVIDKQGGALRLAEFNNRLFEDFRGFASQSPSEFTSYLITGEETLGDLQRYKQGTYLHSFFRRTESGFTIVDGEVIAQDASECLVEARWDWHTTAAGNRWSNPQRAYRYRRPYLPTGVADLFDTGEEQVYTKVKIRGKGRALSLKYTSNCCKDFQLNGFSIAFSSNGE